MTDLSTCEGIERFPVDRRSKRFRVNNSSDTFLNHKPGYRATDIPTSQKFCFSSNLRVLGDFDIGDILILSVIVSNLASEESRTTQDFVRTLLTL